MLTGLQGMNPGDAKAGTWTKQRPVNVAGFFYPTNGDLTKCAAVDNLFAGGHEAEGGKEALVVWSSLYYTSKAPTHHEDGAMRVVFSNGRINGIKNLGMVRSG